MIKIILLLENITYTRSRMAVRYGAVPLKFCKEVRYAGTVRFFCDGTGTVRWYGTPFS